MASSCPQDRFTLSHLHQQVSRGEKIAMLTCYDATTARRLWRGGVRMLLVGDTAAEMVLGFDQTIHAPLDFMIQITAGVRRGAPGALVMADMPFMSYQASASDAVTNAGRFMTEGMADLVKLEVGPKQVDLVERLAVAGVPTVAHIGSRPQQVKLTGGYRSVGKTHEQAKILVQLAGEMAQAGAVMLLIEAVPAEVAEAVVEAVDIPVMGCGAGAACHGFVVVVNDWLGLSDWQPKFAQPAAQLGIAITEAGAQWVARIADGRYPGTDHPYRMLAGEAEKMKD